jgi:hypothetical protein
MITIDIGADRTLVISFRNGRIITLPVVGRTGEFLYKIIFDSQKKPFEERGYCANFPTQHIVNKWLAEKKEANREAEAAKFDERLDALGIDKESLSL